MKYHSSLFTLFSLLLLSTEVLSQGKAMNSRRGSGSSKGGKGGKGSRRVSNAPSVSSFPSDVPSDIPSQVPNSIPTPSSVPTSCGSSKAMGSSSSGKQSMGRKLSSSSKSGGKSGSSRDECEDLMNADEVQPDGGTTISVSADQARSSAPKVFGPAMLAGLILLGWVRL